MINITDKEKCCGCTACYSVCPKNCISMEPDEEGFLYPKVDKNICVNCGLCEDICPVIHLQPKEANKKKKSFVIRSIKTDEVLKSTSGGFFTPLAKWVLENNGLVCAATYDKDFKIIHKLASKDEVDLSKMRGSKYVQSNLNDCFDQIKNCLNKEREVLFIGTTCQVSGLKAYLKKEYENLITVDLVCHGVPSPKLWDRYMDFQKQTYNADIIDVAFRNKTYGYHSGTMKIEFSNGKVYYGSARVDYMLKCFFSEISSRPICYNCPFKTFDRCSDFTIYDCWHASELVVGLDDDDKGYTNVIVQSKKGENILNLIKDSYETYDVSTDKAISLDGVMILNSAVPHCKRFEFYKDLDDNILSDHIKKFISITFIDRILEKSKTFLYKTGLLSKIKRR